MEEKFKLDMPKRPRRLRKGASMLALCTENRVSPDDLILPVFVCEGKNATVKIPPQSHDGDTIGVTLGIPGYSVTSDIAIDLPEDVRIDGDDVVLPLKIPFIVAALGGKVTAKLANESKVKITIPAGTDSGTKFNVSRGSYTGGKCIFVAMVTVPKNLDDVKKTLVRQIAE